MGGIELLGTVCALWGNISQESRSAASHHPAPSTSWWGTSRAVEKPSRGFEGIRESVREFAVAVAAAQREAAGQRAGVDLALPY